MEKGRPGRGSLAHRYFAGAGSPLALAAGTRRLRAGQIRNPRSGRKSRQDNTPERWLSGRKRGFAKSVTLSWGPQVRILSSPLDVHHR